MRRKGPRIGHNWCYQEAESRLKSRLFLSLGNVGKKRFFGLVSPVRPAYLFVHRFSHELRFFLFLRTSQCPKPRCATGR